MTRDTSGGPSDFQIRDSRSETLLLSFPPNSLLPFPFYPLPLTCTTSNLLNFKTSLHHSVTLLPCHSVTLQPCHSVTLFLHHSAAPANSHATEQVESGIELNSASYFAAAGWSPSSGRCLSARESGAEGMGHGATERGNACLMHHTSHSAYLFTISFKIQN